MTEEVLKELSREKLQKVIIKISKNMSEEQLRELDNLIKMYSAESPESDQIPTTVRMSQEVVDEKMKQIETWMRQIDEGELYLNTEEYEDYSSGYWECDWISEYYDNQGIGDKLMSAIRFAKDCLDDRRYPEANLIYEWLWRMSIGTDEEYVDPADLEMLVEKEIIRTDMKQLALQTLYADYQVQEPNKRAECIYLYFVYYPFQKLHIEDMFHVGRENLAGTEQFWRDWIELLKTKNGEAESRLLKEAVLYTEGIEGLIKIADENCDTDPALYLSAMEEFDKKRDYVQIESIGEKALSKMDPNLTIRGEIALKAALAASCLAHTDKAMLFCWETFRSDSTVKNYLRLFGKKEMAELYGLRAKEVLVSRIKGNAGKFCKNAELRKNIIGESGYYELSFYTGEFQRVKQASRNPEGSLEWSSCFVREGIHLFLLYLYEKPLPSKAAMAVANTIGFRDDSDKRVLMDFENEIIEESIKYNISIFWNYFQRWKQYYPLEMKEKKRYLAWAEKIVYSRAEAIVGGQHRGQYGDVAILLAMVAEIKECWGETGTKQEIFAEYKRKFPRHSAFQAEMKIYFE